MRQRSMISNREQLKQMLQLDEKESALCKAMEAVLHDLKTAIDTGAGPRKELELLL